MDNTIEGIERESYRRVMQLECHHPGYSYTYCCVLQYIHEKKHMLHNLIARVAENVLFGIAN